MTPTLNKQPFEADLGLRLVARAVGDLLDLQQGEQLAQLRPADTNAATLYQTPEGKSALVRTIFVCNTTGGGVTFRLFFDKNGTTFDQTTALYYDTAIAANTTLVIDAVLEMSGQQGALGFRTSSADALTATVIGKEF
jgi:hypothetical protein